MEDIHQSLTILADEGQALEFLTNAENVRKINDLVEDIREVLMEYQVCISNCLSYAMSDLCVRPHCKKISTKRTVGAS